MKKLFTLTLLFIALQSIAQDKGFIALSVGGALPLGKFASTDVNNDQAGYAKVGGLADISFGYNLYKNFGVTAVLRGQVNPFDSQKLVDGYEQQSPNSQFTASAKSWMTQSLMLGGYYSLSIGRAEKFSIMPRALLGMANAMLPQIDETIVIGSSTIHATSHGKSALAFSYLLGVGGKFNLNPKWCLLLNVDYTSTNPTFRNVEVSSDYGATQTQDVGFKIQSFNVGFGLGFRL